MKQFFKYFLEGGKVNYDMKKFVQQNKEIKDFVEQKNYTLDIVEIFQLRNLIFQKAVEYGIITQKDSQDKCGSKESLFGYFWIKGLVEQSLNVELVVVNNPFKNKENVK